VTNPREPTDSPLSRADRTIVRLAQGTVVAVMLALASAGRSNVPWPLVAWPVYGTIQPQVPDSTHSVLEVRFRDEDGTADRLRVRDFGQFSRANIANDVLEGSVEEPYPRFIAEDRAHLARLVRLARPRAAFDSLQIWQIEWRVDLTRWPPLDFDRPHDERLLVTFEARPEAAP
jgi:hypothetical protein